MLVQKFDSASCGTEGPDTFADAPRVALSRKESVKQARPLSGETGRFDTRTLRVEKWNRSDKITVYMYSYMAAMNAALASSRFPDFIPDNNADLREAIVHLAGSINFADWQFIKLVRAMDRRESWCQGGFCSLAGWLDYHCGLTSVVARERIRVGRALESLPRIDAAFRAGEISYSKVRAITRVASAETDKLLLGLARTSSANELERLVRTYERTGGATPKGEASTHEARRLEWRYEDGMVIITAALPAEQGALVVQALEQVVEGKHAEQQAYWQTLYEASLGNGNGEPVAVDAEAIGDVSAETGLVETAENVSSEAELAETTEERSAAPCPEACCDSAEEETSETDSLEDDDSFFARLRFQQATPPQRHADALVDVAEHALAVSMRDLRRRRPDRRYEVVLHIARDKLAQQQNGQVASPRYYVDPEWGVDESAARRICCDADITELIEDDRGRLVDITSRSRTVPPGMRRKLEERDGNCCRFPGCHHTRHLEAHHIIHWINGGKTELGNLMLLCSAHHRLHHEGRFKIHNPAETATFVTPDGEIIRATRAPQFPDVSAEALSAAARVPARPCARSPLRRQPPEAVADMVRFRDQWARGKADRFMRRL